MINQTTSDLQKSLINLGDAKRAKLALRYFKTNKGDYGYGDVFLGISTPIIRAFVKNAPQVPLDEIKSLIKSKYHEVRQAGLLLLIRAYDQSQNEAQKEALFRVYVNHFKYVNNWDLVDVTAPHLVGKHLHKIGSLETNLGNPLSKNSALKSSLAKPSKHQKTNQIDSVRLPIRLKGAIDRSILKTWAKSPHLWTRRIAMVSCLWFIRSGDLNDTFKIAQILMNDPHDLIHKAIGWMLREAGKKDRHQTDQFLAKHYKKMPRTALRYAIEKHSIGDRKKYLTGTK